MIPHPPIPTLFPYTTLFRSHGRGVPGKHAVQHVDPREHPARQGRRHRRGGGRGGPQGRDPSPQDRKSTRLNSSHRCISYAVFCLKKKKKKKKKNKQKNLNKNNNNLQQK